MAISNLRSMMVIGLGLWSAVTVTEAGCTGSGSAGDKLSQAGKACNKDDDCASGICLPPSSVGVKGGSPDAGNVCSTQCDVTADCVPGWACEALQGQSSNVCQCTVTDAACDGLDHACTGLPSPVCPTTDPNHPPTCGDGVCHTVTPVVATPDGVGGEFVLNSTSVFWVTNSASGLRVHRAPKSGGADEVLATFTNVFAIDNWVVDDSSFYLGYRSDSNSTTVVAIRLSDTQKTVLSQTTDVGRYLLRSDGSFLYWCRRGQNLDGWRFEKVPAGGGAPVFSVPSSCVGWRAPDVQPTFDEASFYWADTQSQAIVIHAISLDSGTDKTLASIPSDTPSEPTFASDGNALSVGEQQSGGNTAWALFRVQTAGGTVKSVAQESSPADYHLLSADNNSVFAARSAIHSWNLLAYPVNGGSPMNLTQASSTQVLGIGGGSHHFVVESGYVYWGEYDALNTNTSAIWRVNIH